MATTGLTAADVLTTITDIQERELLRLLARDLAQVYTVDTDQAAILRLVLRAKAIVAQLDGVVPQTPKATRRRYCGPCDRWVAWRHRECPACGADTEYVRAGGR